MDDVLNEQPEEAVEAVQAAPSGDEAAALQPVPPAPMAGQSIADAFEAWFAAHIPNSPVSRDTAAYNRIHAAAMEIRAALFSVKE